MILGISQRKLLIAVIVQSETPAISQAAHSKSIWNTKSSGIYQPIMSDPVISTLISKQHVIWWVCPILQYSQPLPSNWSTCFLQLSWHFALPIFFVLAFEGLATPGWPCRQTSRLELSWLWHRNGLLFFFFSFTIPFSPLFPFRLFPLCWIRTIHCLLIRVDSWCTIVTHPRIPVLGPGGCTMTHGLTLWLTLFVYICYRLRVLNYKYPVVAVVGP